MLVQALQMRKDAGRPGVTFLSCDNLTDNGAVLQKAVTGAAPSDLADWIAAHVRFPSTMVDRITPATTAELRAEVAEQAGWADEIPVETEAFSQWVIEDNFAAGRPDWEHAGAELVPDVAPYEQMKLRMLNGAHSMLAYCGHLTGKVYVRDVMADPALAALVARHMDAAAATLDPGTGLNPSAYRDQLLTRFRNPHIAHKTYQIAMDGSQKMPQRIFAPAQDAVRRGQDVTPFSLRQHVGCTTLAVAPMRVMPTHFGTRAKPNWQPFPVIQKTGLMPFLRCLICYRPRLPPIRTFARRLPLIFWQLRNTV